MTKVKLEGFKELELALRQLPKATGKTVLRRVARGALEPLADAAAAKAPIETGKLAFHIAISEKRTRRARGGAGGAKFLGIGADGKKMFGKSDAKNSIEMAMGPASGQGVLKYASFVEFGTVDTPAQPYMRPAWDQGADRALDHVKDNLGREITRAADRLARKRAKAGL